MTSLPFAKSSPKVAVGWLLTLVLSAAAALLPAGEIFTNPIKWFCVITIFCIMLFAFELIHSTIIALLLPLLYHLCNLAPLGTILSPWTQTTVWMTLGGILLGNVFEQTGILQRISYFFIIKARGSFKGVLYALVLSGCILAYIMPGGAMVLYFVLVYGMCKTLKVEAGSKSAALLFFAAYIAGVTCTQMLTYGSLFDLTMNMARTVDPTMAISYAEYAVHCAIFYPALFLMVFLALKIMKPDQEIQSLAYFKERMQELGPMKTSEKKSAGIMAVMLIFLFFQTILGLDMYEAFMLAAILCFLPFVRIGADEVVEKTAYGTLFFMGGTMSIGVVANATGAGALLAEYLVPLLDIGNLYGLVAAVWIIGYLLNFLLTPLAAATVIAAPVTQALLSLGYWPEPILYALLQAFDNALLPYEAAGFILLYSFGMMKLTHFIKLFTMKAVFSFLYTVFIATTFWWIIGLFDAQGFFPILGF